MAFFNIDMENHEAPTASSNLLEYEFHEQQMSTDNDHKYSVVYT